MAVPDLMIWTDTVLSPKAKQAYNGDGPQVPGIWCQFCKVKSCCRALASQCVNAATTNQDPKLLTPEEIATDILPILATVKTWLAGVEDYALQQALSGIHLPGWKVVEGRSIRKITDTQGAAAALCKAGFSSDEIYKPIELRTITELEKLAGKKQFAAICGDYVTKPHGKPTLAPDSDKRSAIDPLTDDFKDVIV